MQLADVDLDYLTGVVAQASGWRNHRNGIGYCPALLTSPVHPVFLIGFALEKRVPLGQSRRVNKEGFKRFVIPCAYFVEAGELTVVTSDLPFQKCLKKHHSPFEPATGHVRAHEASGL
jgi:hypothetical protein